MIHEMLYQSEDLSSINFSAYLRNLVYNLCDSYGVNNVQSIFNGDQTHLNLETSIPLGLITSELVSNSLKYAFPNKKPGKLTISLKNQNDHHELIIKDNGIGFPEDLDFRKIESSLGLKLVISLVNQINGTIEQDRSHGTKYTIKFQEIKYKERI
jgi:two-component sensor histidine kinase